MGSHIGQWWFRRAITWLSVTVAIFVASMMSSRMMIFTGPFGVLNLMFATISVAPTKKSGFLTKLFQPVFDDVDFGLDFSLIPHEGVPVGKQGICF